MARLLRGRRLERLLSMSQPVLQQGADESEDSCRHVVEHDSGAFGEAFEFADRPGLEDVEEAEEDESEDSVAWGGGQGDECDELSGDFVDDDVAWVLFTGFAGDDGGGRDSDECDDGCGDGGPNRQRRG